MLRGLSLVVQEAQDQEDWAKALGMGVRDAVGSSHGAECTAVLYKHVTFTRNGRTLGYQNLLNADHPLPHAT